MLPVWSDKRYRLTHIHVTRQSPLRGDCHESTSQNGISRDHLLKIQKSSVKEKTLILNEFCLNCGYHRKHAIRLLNHFKRFTKPKPKKRGKRSKYNKASILKPLKKIWLTANLPCSKRLKVILPLWLPSYAKEFGASP